MSWYMYCWSQDLRELRSTAERWMDQPNTKAAMDNLLGSLKEMS